MKVTSWDIVSLRSNCKEGISAKTAHLCKDPSPQRHHLCKDPIFAKTAHLHKDPIFAMTSSPQRHHLCKDGTSPQRHDLRKDVISANVDLHSIETMMGVHAVSLWQNETLHFL
jgi:hypothetical protein